MKAEGPIRGREKKKKKAVENYRQAHFRTLITFKVV